MKDTYISAKLVAPDLIRFVLLSSLTAERMDAYLWTDGVQGPRLIPVRKNSLSSVTIADYRLPERLELGHRYNFAVYPYGVTGLDVSEATTFPGFDDEFYYDGEDLGATYTKKATRFALWAPLASSVMLKYRPSKKDNWSYAPLQRSPKGVYRGSVKGDCEGYEYRYIITNCGYNAETTDPYAKASTCNGEDSVVADWSKFSQNFKRDCLPILNSPNDAIIYETHVRDFTIDPSTNILRKGTYLGLIEPGRKTKGGHPAGFDHLVKLGITHLQLMPIYDFKTVDERHPDKIYNWGYDPLQYFVPEGGFASVVEDPFSRIRDVKTMVSALHSKGIRVVMDVVFNHVYEYQTSVFEKVVPNFYFRKRGDGHLTNTSGCGNDLASERPMVRKLILDACKWWIEQYGIDGFRFDLMGIIDVETLNQVKMMALSHDPSFLLYGEGWNMGGEVSLPLGTMANYKLLPDYAFFNDFYRERMKDYWCGNLDARQSMKYAYCSSSLNFIHPARFLDGKQSINYVECHDNETFFDTLSARRKDLSEEEKLELVSSANLAILLSYGIPFLHMGQEIGESKWGHGNTYNMGDGYNKMSYKLMDERYWMVENIAKAISFRKKSHFLHAYDPSLIDKSVDVEDRGAAISIRYIDMNEIAPLPGMEVYINPTADRYPLQPDTPMVCLLSSQQTPEADPTEVPPRSVIVLSPKK